MSHVYIKFKSSDGTQTEVLTYKLHDHPIAHRWVKVVKMSHRMGLFYKTKDCFYGGAFTPLEKQTERFFSTLSEVKKSLPSLLKDPLLGPILSSTFEINQTHLNLAHVLFERGIQETLHAPKDESSPVRLHLFQLNTSIHQIEAELSPIKGFFLDCPLFYSLRSKINPDENRFFSLDRMWGELYLNYCHTGESYAQVFQHDYPSEAVPQTDIASGFIMQFQESHRYAHGPKLQEWMNNYIGHEVDFKDYPLGLVPLGTIQGDWSQETIHEFFRNYPVMEPVLKFD